MKPTIPLVSALTILLSSGCSILPKVDFTPPPPVKVITEEVKMDIYQPPLPQEIKMENVDWFVITKNNFEFCFDYSFKILSKASGVWLKSI